MFVKLMVGLHANNILKLENHKYKKETLPTDDESVGRVYGLLTYLL